MGKTVTTSLGELQGTAEHVALGRHLIAEVWSGDPTLLNDPTYLRDSVVEAIRAGGLTLIEILAHEFSPHGVTLVALLAESHLSIHTWPEHGYAAVDVFSCDGDPETTLDVLTKRLRAVHVETYSVERGVLWKGDSLVFGR